MYRSYRRLLDNTDFTQWQDDPELQIKGDPGESKTMLLWSIVDRLNQSTMPSILSPFCCQGTDASINNVAAVLHGLIYLADDR